MKSKSFEEMAKVLGIEVGQSYMNNDPYEGEGEIMVAAIGDELFARQIKCIHAVCEKYPELNGTVMYFDIQDIVEHYTKLKQ